MFRLLIRAVSSTSMVLLTVILYNNFNTLSGQCADLQYEALVDFFNSTGGEDWRRNDGWNEDCEFCNWYGITCDGSGNVIEINLKSNRLSGSIPSSISDLTYLQELIISSNNFNSGLPEEIGSFPALEILDIGYAKLNGPIPSEIGDLPSLTSLNLSGNPFSGGLPGSIGNLSSLEILNIFNTGLAGAIPASIGELSGLKELRIGINNFSGNLPVNIGDLSSLEVLELVVEDISGKLPVEIGNLSSLKYLYIQHTDIDGEIPESIGNLTFLEELYINNNLISGPIPESIGNLTRLYELYLINNNLEGSLPETIGNLQALIRFYGYNNKISGMLPESIGQLSALKTLDLSNNSFSGEFPSTMAGMTSLKTLFLNNNKLEGEIPSTFDQLSSLLNLDIGNNFLTGCIPKELNGWCSLPYLITEPNCFFKPFSSMCAGELCNGFIENPTLGFPICEGESLTLETVKDQMEYLWSNGSQDPYIDIQPVEDISYTVTATNPYGCKIEAETSIEVNNIQTTEIHANVCFGESYTVGQEAFTISGEYSVKLQDQNGCDSIVNLNLYIREQNHNNLFANICEGEEYIFGDNILNQSGTYHLHVQDQYGCDSSVILNLEVNEREVIHIIDTTCFGEPYQLYGESFYYEGVYEFIVDNGGLCPSKVIFDLAHLPSDHTIIDTFICEGSSVFFYDTWLSKEGPYSLPFVNQYGCDSIVQLNINISDPIVSFEEKSICEGESYDFNGRTITSSGSYEYVLESTNGCDSTVFLDVSVKDIDTMSIDTILCYGETLTFNDEEFNSPGTFLTSLNNDGSCNEMMVINLDYHKKIESTLIETICEGATFNFNGTDLSQPGEYIGIFYSNNGCDSIVNLQLAVSYPDTSVTSISICSGDSYIYSNDTLDTTGVYTYTYQNKYGCDSIAILNIQVEEPEESYTSMTLCEGQSVTIDNFIYNSSTTIIDTLYDLGGCTKVEYLTLDFIPNTTSKVSETICYGGQVSVGGQYFDETGNYIVTLSNSLGCDSIIELSLEVIEQFDSTINIELCPNDLIIIEDSTISDPGEYVFNYSSRYGCDSTIVIFVNLLEEEADSVFVTICEGDSYLLNGKYYSESGQYQSSNTVGSCVKTIDLFLSVEPLTTLFIQKEICHGSTYNYRGLKFSTEGIHEFLIASSEYCDTAVILDLAFYEIKDVEISGGETSCEGEEILLYASGYETYQWSTNSMEPTTTVTASGIYKLEVTDENGCRSSGEITVSFISHQINSVAVTDNQSCDESSGAITIDASTDLGELEYSIDGGLSWQSNHQVNNLSGGIYHVVTRVKDFGCTALWEDDVLLNDIGALEYEVVIIQEPLCPGDQNGIVYVDMVDESSVKSISWADGYIGGYREGLAPGTFIIALENLSGCIQYASVDIQEPAPIIYDDKLASDSSFCVGDNLLISIPQDEYDYTWYGPFGYIADTNEISLNDPGIYTLEISDYRGCVLTDSIDINLLSEDFSGVDFLLSKKGFMDAPIVIVDVSWPVPDQVEWYYNSGDIILLDSMENQMIVEFQDTGMYEISMLATIGECSSFISKEIMIYKGEGQTDPNIYIAGLIQDVNIFPNPNFGVFSVRTSLRQEAAILLTIVNTSGKLVYQKNLSGDNLYAELIDISSEPPGVYAIVIQTKTESRYFTISKN